MDQIMNNENRKVILQVNQKNNANETELDLINIFSHMGKKKKLMAYLLTLAILVGAAAGVLYSGFEHMSGKGSYARALVTFQFEGIESGISPNGSAFDVSMLKSPNVIQNALTELGLDEIYTDSVRRNIVIQGVIPEDAVEQITTFEKMAEKDASKYEKILDVSYFPSQYIIYLYDDGTFSPRELTEILDGIIVSYRQYFMDTYANTEVLTVTSNLLSGSDYDYGESVDLVKTQIDIMLSYVNEKLEEAPDFRSSQTGLSYEDIVTALQFVQSVDISKLSSFVESNALTKDKNRQIEYYEYMIRECSNKISELQTQLESVTNTINNYEKDPVVVVSSSDSTLEYGEKNAYYDTLVNQKISLNKQISVQNTSLNEYYLQLNSLQAHETANDQSQYDYADGLLQRLDTTISSWVTLIEQTTEEYYKTTLFSNAVKASVAPQYYMDGGIVHIAKNIIIAAGALVLLVLIWWFFDATKTEIGEMRRREEMASDEE